MEMRQSSCVFRHRKGRLKTCPTFSAVLPNPEKSHPNVETPGAGFISGLAKSLADDPLEHRV
jgi:hypothetical protein